MLGLQWMLIISATSFFLFVALLSLTSVEEKKGGRIFAVRFRSFLDLVFERVTSLISRWYISITRHKMKLSWYYSIHAVLVALMAFLATVYHKIERIVILNRVKAKKLRKEKQSFKKSHLSEIAEHKESVQLSEEEQTRRKDKSLSGQ